MQNDSRALGQVAQVLEHAIDVQVPFAGIPIAIVLNVLKVGMVEQQLVVR